MSREGFEPSTRGLKIRCSTQTELPALKSQGYPAFEVLVSDGHGFLGELAGIRTPDLEIKSLLLYQTELRAQESTAYLRCAFSSKLDENRLPIGARAQRAGKDSNLRPDG